MSRTAQPRQRRTHRARRRRPTFAKRPRRLAPAAFFDPALDRDRDLPHPPVDAAPLFAAAPQRRAGLLDAGKEAAHRSGEHNREPERNIETAENEERGRRRPELRPSTTAAPLSHRKWDCLTVPEVAERACPPVGDRSTLRGDNRALTNRYRKLPTVYAGPDGSGRGASGGVWASLTF
jgi:hypothetical protein